MKHFWSVLLLLGSILVISACNKPNSTITSRLFMTATVGTTTWNAATTSSNYTVTGVDTTLYVTGKASNGQMIQLIFLDFHHYTGPYYIGSSAAAAYYTDSVNYTSAATGQLIIQTMSASTITGSFNFKTSDSTMVSMGSFSIKAF